MQYLQNVVLYFSLIYCVLIISLICGSLKWMWFIKIKQYLFMWVKRLYWCSDLRGILIASSFIAIFVLPFLRIVYEKKVWYFPCKVHPSAHQPNKFNQDNSGPAPYNEEIVPNIVHYYITGNETKNISFIDALCLYAAFRIAAPKKIIIHTDDVVAVANSFIKSPYGKRIMQVPELKRIIDIQYWPMPQHVFGIEFRSIYKNNHINDVTRLRILRKYGGIFLDRHSFLLKNPNKLRYYEMTIFENKGVLSNHFIIAHRDARMLDLWLKSYHRYDPDIEDHHQTHYLKTLFAQKYTFYHKLEQGMKNISVNILNSKDQLPFKVHDDCFILFFTSSKMPTDFESENEKLGFESDSIINFVENYINSIKE